MRHKCCSRGWRFGLAFLAVFLAAESCLFAQVGASPGGRRRNYPLGGLGVPMPDLPTVTYRGKLRKMDEKVILLDLDDGRSASFQRSHKTKFFKDSKEIKPSELHIGDRVSLDAAEDPQAFLNALKVTFDNSPAPVAEERKNPEAAETERGGIQYDDKGRPTLRKRNPTGSEESAGSGSSSGTEAPPADTGAPTLRRRNQEQPERADASEVAPTPPSSRMDNPQRDALIEKARAAAAPADKLPSFMCEEVMSRASRDANASNWQPIDVVSAEVVNQGGQESQRNFKVNDRPVEKADLSGSWPIGKLVSTLSDLLAPTTQFWFGGDTSLTTLQARVYDFDVARENSQWIMRMGSQSISAAYSGTVYIDKDSGRMLRLEMLARDLPQEFPMDRLETDVEYGFVRLGGEQVVLPVHVETMGCQRATGACTRSVIDFKNYRAAN